MQEKMDGAARRADKVAQRVLPERPHHLSKDANRKYPGPPGFWFTGPSQRLQYMTYISDADRGVLLTLPFFEILDEPENLTPSMASISRGEAKKKMSFKDYQNRKKSVSPAYNDPVGNPDYHQPNMADSKAHRENGRRDDTKLKAVDSKQSTRAELNGER
jgi:hypothetical protein